MKKNILSLLIASAIITGTASTAFAGLTIQVFMNYTAGIGGTILGEASQEIPWSHDGTTVTAVANPGYHFVNWSDGSTMNPRTDILVTSNINVTANFELNPVIGDNKHKNCNKHEGNQWNNKHCNIDRDR